MCADSITISNTDIKTEKEEEEEKNGNKDVFRQVIKTQNYSKNSKHTKILKQQNPKNV